MSPITLPCPSPCSLLGWARATLAVPLQRLLYPRAGCNGGIGGAGVRRWQLRPGRTRVQGVQPSLPGWRPAASPGPGDEGRDEPRHAGGSEAVPSRGGGQGWVPGEPCCGAEEAGGRAEPSCSSCPLPALFSPKQTGRQPLPPHVMTPHQRSLIFPGEWPKQGAPAVGAARRGSAAGE